MTAVTKIAAHQQGGSDASLGFAEVGHTRLLWADLERFRGPETTLDLLEQATFEHPGFFCNLGHELTLGSPDV